MKKIISTIILIVCMTMNVHAIRVDVDGIRYEIISTTDLTARVLGFADVEFADVVIPEYIEYYGKPFKVIEIYESAFKGTEATPNLLTHITLPNTLQKIGSWVFAFSNLEELIIPDNVTYLGGRIADRSVKLKKFVFGRGVKTIQSGNIYQSPAVDHVFIPNTVDSLHIFGIVSSRVKNIEIEDANAKLVPTDNEYTYLFTDLYGEKKQNGGDEACLFPCCEIQNLYLGRNMFVKGATTKILPKVENITVGPKVTDIRGLFNLNYMQKIKLITTTPPAFSIGYASTECYMRIKVYVPKGSLNAYKNHAEWGKYWNIEEYDDACAAPEILYEDGMLKLTPVTPGSICYYTLSDDDIVTDKEMTGCIKLSGTYNIDAYAMLNGAKSEHSFATLCWLDNTFTSTGITQPIDAPKRQVLIKSNNGQIAIEGLEDGEAVDLYTIDGKHLGHTLANGNSATFQTMQQSGKTIILRAGENSVKFILR